MKLISTFSILKRKNKISRSLVLYKILFKSFIMIQDIKANNRFPETEINKVVNSKILSNKIENGYIFILLHGNKYYSLSKYNKLCLMEEKQIVMSNTNKKYVNTSSFII